jgi:hypothetical protein
MRAGEEGFGGVVGYNFPIFYVFRLGVLRFEGGAAAFSGWSCYVFRVGLLHLRFSDATWMLCFRGGRRCCNHDTSPPLSTAQGDFQCSLCTRKPKLQMYRCWQQRCTENLDSKVLEALFQRHSANEPCRLLGNKEASVAAMKTTNCIPGYGEPGVLRVCVYTILYYIILCYVMLYYIALHYIILYHIIIYIYVLYCIVLYYIILD